MDKETYESEMYKDRGFLGQYELLKVVAEQNKEKMFEYDVQLNTAFLFEVKNGQIVQKEARMNYYTDGQLNDTMVVKEDQKVYVRALNQCLKRPTHTVIDVRFLQDNGETEWMRFFLVSVAIDSQKVDRIVGRLFSVQKEKLEQEKMRRRAEIDDLTNTYNHVTFQKCCDEIVPNYDSYIAVMMIDIDDFKMINDSMGHSYGDMVLKRMGSILNKAVLGRGIVGRMGGDEFAICVWDFVNEDEIIAFGQELRYELQNIVYDAEYSASIGVSISEGHALQFIDMYNQADKALYMAKRNGKNQIIVYNKTLDDRQFLIDDEILSDENHNDFVLDNQKEYVLVIDMHTDKVLYANKSAKQDLLSEDARIGQTFGSEIFRKTVLEQKQETSDNKRNAYYSRNCLDSEFIREEKRYHTFTIQYRQVIWKSLNVLLLELIDMDDKEQLKDILTLNLEHQQVLSKCILNVTTSEKHIQHKQILHMLAEFYGADSMFLFTENSDKKAQCLDMYHKESYMQEACGFADDIQTLNFELLSELKMTSHYHFIKQISELKQGTQLYDVLEKHNIKIVFGNVLSITKQIFGYMIMLNPRKNVSELSLMNQVGMFLASDIIQQGLSAQRETDLFLDKVTGLENKQAYLNWEGRITDQNTIGLICVDVCSYDEVIKNYGIEFGDKILKEVADTLREICGGYRIFRFDITEMVVYCEGMTREQFAQMVRFVREKLDELPYKVATGCNWSARESQKILYDDAKLMLDRDRIRLMTETGESIDLRDKVYLDVRKAIDEGRFIVYLQPKVDVRTYETVGAEALIRYKDADGKVIGPVHFITYLEQHRLIPLIDFYVIEEVFKFQQDNLRQGKKLIPISVNFSKKTMVSLDMLDKLKAIVERYDVPVEMINIEITESVGDMDQFQLHTMAKNLQSIGFNLIMDDFGTEYSNLETLSQFKFDTIKIDRSIVNEITKNSKSCIVLKHLIEMLLDLDLEFVVEGAETKEQVELLQELKCKTAQGFFFGKPIPYTEFYDAFM